MVFIVLCMMLLNCSVRAQDPLDRVASLRTQQTYASYNEYYDYEKQLITIKQGERQGVTSHPNNVQPLWSHWQILATHTFPFIMWQLLALLSAGLLLLWRGRPWLLWCVAVLTTGVVWATFHERSTTVITIAKSSTPVRVGPSDLYPQCATLHYLDEVVLVKQRIEYQKKWLQVAYDNRVGWIEYD